MSLSAVTPRTVHVLLFAVIVLGTMLRFVEIDAKSLWGDEILSLAFATGHSYFPWQEEPGVIRNADYYRAFLFLEPNYFSQRLFSLLSTETQVPFYFFLLNLWVHFFGSSETALRSLSVIASVASIPVLYALGRSLASAETAVYAALFFSVAPFQIAFAQYNRPYALLGFFALLSTLAAVRLWRGDNSLRWPLTYAVATILGLYTHYLFIWNIVFHWILVTFRQRNNARFLLRWALTQASSAAAFLPWAPVFIAQLSWNREAPSLTWFYWLSGKFPLFDVVSYFGRDLALLLSVGRIHGICFAFDGGDKCRLDAVLTGLFYIVPVLVLSLSAWQFAGSRFTRSMEEKNSWAVCLLWVLCIFGGPLAVDLLANSHMIQTHRYFISASGPLYLAVAMTFSSVANTRLRLSMITGFLAFLLAGTGLYLADFSGTLIYQQGIRGVAQYLDRSVTDNDLVVVLNPGAEPMDIAYYLQSNSDFARIDIPGRWRVSSDIPTQLSKLTTSRKRLWYLDDQGPEKQAREATLGWLRSRYKEMQVREFKNLDLFFFSEIDG